MKKMVFDVKRGLSFRWCGRFVPPSDSWIHMARRLVDYEFVYVTEGTLSIACDDDTYEVRTGEYLIMPPASLQRGTRRGACTFYWMHFEYDGGRNDHEEYDTACEGVWKTESEEAEKEKDCEAVGTRTASREKTAQEAGGRLVISKRGQLKNPGRVVVLLNQLQDADKTYRDQVLNNALCTAVLAEAALQDGPENSQEKNSEMLCGEVKDYVKWHLGEELRVSEIARYFDYNAKYLTTFFRKNTGMSLKEYIQSQKIDKAKALLTQTDITVAEAGYSLGFSDPHNFSSCFKKVCGMAPGAYRDLYGYFEENRS